MYPRKVFPELLRHLDNKQITVLTGMRRTGKTTLVKELLIKINSANKLYIDLERIDNRELFAAKNYDAIIYALKQRGVDFSRRVYLILDEIQLVRNIASALKYLYDNYDIKFIVTGSSSFYLKNLFSESLAGRKKIFELYPLDFGEFLTFKQVPFAPGDFLKTRFAAAEYERLKPYYEEYIEYGGFPETVLAAKTANKQDLLQDIISSYINVDVASLADFRRRDGIASLIKMLASRVGTRLDYAKLSRLSGLSRLTVKNYLDFFENTYLIFRAPVHTKNADREIVKAKKLFFCDNGLLGVLGDVSGGSKFENAVFAQLRQKGEIKYFSLKSGREIDFIFDNQIALEAKETPTVADQKELSDLSGQAGISQIVLIGRYHSPDFKDYIWGGDIK